ncbi:MAG: endonuclease/exonuclease/phosphatase [Deltaproteobacteria bacterium]|nr:endonuclease/exonuclease/phosphatase [Deltaproteobacteria bacterium]MCB9487673.1 endonuclease/exonuclease/phosphatase [Deltaproteobacteria bacterium]
MTSYYVAWWNVENLFDKKNSGHRTDKLERTLENELKGWTAAIRDKKLKQLASIIVRMNGGQGPDLLGVCEVENREIITMLVDRLSILGRPYDIVHTESKDNRGIDVAFIYDTTAFTVESDADGDKIFDHWIVKRNATRDILQVNFMTRHKRRLVAIANHWPSRSGGQFESEPYRIIAGETLAYFHERIREIHGDDVAVVAMGDFNDEPFDRSLMHYALSYRHKERATRATNPTFLNLMWPLMGDGRGSHYFDGFGMLDQFLVSEGVVKSGLPFSVKDKSVEVLNFPEMLKGRYKQPKRFGRPSSASTFDETGFSDHFPIAMVIEEKD